jgi:eukaryotic-like serine/threonine-protein kinase
MARDLVFVSYRRSDAAAQAGRLAAELKWRFGEERVWFDTDSISGGQSFPGRIREALGRARVVLVVMGKGWLPALRRRIDDPEDWVRQEVAAALEFQNDAVIPVLVDGAKMPRPKALPDAVAQLAERHCMRLEHTQFTSHAEQITRRIRELGVEELANTELYRRLTDQPAVAPVPLGSRKEMASAFAAGDPELVALRADKMRIAVAGRDTSELDDRILLRQRQLRDSDDVGPGTRLNSRFELIDPAGVGGFATVWRAYDHQHERVVAVKLLHRQHAEDLTRRQRFFRGAQRMAVLRHPHVVRVLQESGHDGKAVYFVMDYLAGGDLLRRVRSGTWRAELTLPTLLGVAEALQCAHVLDLVHRDVKPANILLDEHDAALLTDFDLVRAPDTTGGTRTGALGTFLYAAPEAMGDASRVDGRADVYSLSMVAIFLLLGKDLPPEALRDSAVLIRDLHAPPPLKQLLTKGCAWSADERFQSMAEFVEALRAVRTAAGATGGDNPLGRAANERVGRPVRGVMVPIRDSLDRGEGVGSVSAVAYLDPSLSAVVTNPPFKPIRPVQTAYSAAGSANVIHDKTEIELVWIPGGKYRMGSPEGQGEQRERPQHEVTVSEFLLGKSPVTNEQFARFLQANPEAKEPEYWADRRFNQALQPVVGVSWEDAQAYAEWAGLRLPTEAEWEYACRAGTKKQYSSGDTEEDLGRVGWFRGNSEGRLHEVGEKPPNDFGLYDLHGNVWEWCADWYGLYAAKAATDPTGSDGGDSRVLRGGSWVDGAQYARSAARIGARPAVRENSIGFRLARGRRTSK